MPVGGREGGGFSLEVSGLFGGDALQEDGFIPVSGQAFHKQPETKL